MLLNIAGALGLAVQIAIGVMVFSYANRKPIAFRALAAAIAAVYGYGLLLSFGMLLAVPWQFWNLLFFASLSIALAFESVRGRVLFGLGDLVHGARQSSGAVLILLLTSGVQFFVNALKPELSIDGQLYHGPILANLVNTGTLWGWTPTNQYVYYTDLTMASSVNMATFTGETWFDDAAQVPHLVILMLVIIWALRTRFSSSLLRATVALLVVSAPVIWVQPRILYVDVAYAGAVAASAVLIVLVRDWDKFLVLVSATAIAAVFASKPTGILTGFLLLITLMVSVFIRYFRDRRHFNGSYVAAWLKVSWLAVLPLIAGLAFYVRNLVAFNNPVYPVKTAVAAVNFPGVIDLKTFASGDRGDGLFDPGRIEDYFRNIWQGIQAGVTKLDYDPREGGFGYVPLILVGILLVTLAVELIGQARTRSPRSFFLLPKWRAQLGLIAIALGIFSIQPATFDSRYVIGPTVVILIAIFLIGTGFRMSLNIQRAIAMLCIFVALAQVTWTEKRVFMGLQSVLDLRGLSTEHQPNTPGNPWGRSQSIAWLPQHDCVSLAVETQGGLTPTGLVESSQLAGLSYGLYGESLCNTVQPITHQQYGSAISSTRDSIASADYILLYEPSVDAWAQKISNFNQCWVAVDNVAGNEMWPENILVFSNRCNS